MNHQQHNALSKLYLAGAIVAIAWLTATSPVRAQEPMVESQRGTTTQEEFARVDVNDDNVISTDELFAYGNGQRRFETIDENGDGQITSTEWRAQPSDVEDGGPG